MDTIIPSDWREVKDRCEGDGEEDVRLLLLNVDRRRRCLWCSDVGLRLCEVRLRSSLAMLCSC